MYMVLSRRSTYDFGRTNTWSCKAMEVFLFIKVFQTYKHRKQCLKLRAIEFSGSLAKTLFYRYSGAIRRYSALMSIAIATSGCYSGAILVL